MLKGYRTFIAAGLTIVFGILAQTDWLSFFDNPKSGLLAIGIGILMAAFRLATDTPPGRSTPLPPRNSVDKH